MLRSMHHPYMESLFAYEVRLHKLKFCAQNLQKILLLAESLAVQKVDHFTATVTFAAEFVLDLNQGTYSTTV